MKAVTQKRSPHEELKEKLQEDINIILEDFDQFMRGREEEEHIKAHFDVDFIIKSIHHKKAKKSNSVATGAHKAVIGHNDYNHNHSYYDSTQFYNEIPLKKSSRFLRTFMI